MKTCNICKVEKSDSDFYRLKTGRLFPYCRPCDNERKRKWAKANPDIHRAAMRRGNRKYRACRPDRVKAQQRKRTLKKYGMSVEDYEQRLLEQGGVCQICSKNNDSQRLAVDHCHINGRVRGLLCHRCNRALGYLGDNKELLLKCVAYLDHYKDN
jgi:hypothetical protein